jgi:hypothetical protein
MFTSFEYVNSDTIVIPYQLTDHVWIITMFGVNFLTVLRIQFIVIWTAYQLSLPILFDDIYYYICLTAALADYSHI